MTLESKKEINKKYLAWAILFLHSCIAFNSIGCMLDGKGYLNWFCFETLE